MIASNKENSGLVLGKSGIWMRPEKLAEAEQLAARVQIHLERGQFEAATDIMENAGRLADAPVDKITSLDAPLAQTDLCVRTVNVLEELGVTTLGELLDTLQNERPLLLATSNIGPKIFAEIEAVAAKAAAEVHAYELSREAVA